jgi:cytochrome b
MTAEGSRHRRLLVWDVPTRMFHWFLVVATVTAFATGFVLPEWWLGAHRTAGYTILVLLVFRFVWAAFGSEYSRLGSFTYSPNETFDHLRGLLLLSPRHYVGHNPAGAAMIFALAAVLCGLVFTGLAIEGGEEKIGPLAGIASYALGNAAKTVHWVLVWTICLMVAAHVAGVVVESLLTRENLVASMITGYKIVPADAHLPAPLRPHWGAALASFAVVVGAGALALVLLGRMPPRGIPPHAVNATYVETCGACHPPYHPSLLPADSWQNLLSRLDDHFGMDNSKLPTPALVEIAGYLATHSAEAWDTEAGVRFRTASKEEPRRVTATPGWRSIHARVPESWFDRNSVGGKSRCAACHRDAATGRFADSHISAPKD